MKSPSILQIERTYINLSPTQTIHKVIKKSGKLQLVVRDERNIAVGIIENRIYTFSGRDKQLVKDEIVVANKQFGLVHSYHRSVATSWEWHKSTLAVLS